MEVQLEGLQKFFDSAHWPQQIERRQTFFSIAGFPHYENVMSNVYSFFFNTNNPHNLGSLFIDSLIDVLKQKGVKITWTDDAFKRAYSLREVGVAERQRLDLLIHNGLQESEWQGSSAAILIENKIYHWLANDLNNYWESIDLGDLNEQKIGVVLGLRREVVPLNWVYVSHAELAKAIENRLGAALYRAEPRYVTLLLELIENIHAMSNTNKEFKELAGFFQRNRAQISQAEKIRGQLFQQLADEIRNSLPSDYSIWQNAEARRDGWLVIHKSGSQRCSYVLGYYDVFYKDDKPTYRIELHANPDDVLYPELKQNILSLDHVRTHNIEQDNRNPHHIAGKTYHILSDEFPNLPLLISEKLRIDWFPIENHWTDDNVMNNIQPL